LPICSQETPNIATMESCLYNGVYYTPRLQVCIEETMYQCWLGKWILSGPCSKTYVVSASDGNPQWGLALGVSYPTLVISYDYLYFQWNGLSTVTLLTDAASYAVCNFSASIDVADQNQACSDPSYEHCVTWKPPRVGRFYFASTVGDQCQKGVKLIIEEDPEPCISGNATYLSHTQRCGKGTLYECIYADWTAIGFCANCTFDNETFYTDDFICNGSTRNVCSFGTWIQSGLCANCSWNQSEATYVSGDHVCDNSTSMLCYDGGWETEGTCVIYPEDAVALLQFAGPITECDVVGWASNSTNPCEWTGIFCDNESIPVTLNLSHFGCWGAIDLSLLLDTLRVVDLSFNHFTGWQDLLLPPLLEELDLYNNSFSGNITLLRLPQTLKLLDFGLNGFSGTPNFSSLPPLVRSLGLSHNSFSGHVKLYGLPASLFYLDISSNYFIRLNGSHLSQLSYFSVENNPWLCPLPVLPPWIEIPPCTIPTCTLSNTRFMVNDYVCVQGKNQICNEDGVFVTIGSCVQPELVNCSQWNRNCASSWSNNVSQSLLFCGHDGDLTSALTLCYLGDAEHYCDNGRNILGSVGNWLLGSNLASHRGFTCPAY
jgi:hypothetical protein